MIAAKATIQAVSDHVFSAPVFVPDLDEVRAFAQRLHAQGEAWTGDAFGWSAEYNPESSTRPLDSKMTFTPADFCVGESGVWFFSMMWEDGKSAEPTEYLDDENIAELDLPIG